jgi:hypothetical protein
MDSLIAAGPGVKAMANLRFIIPRADPGGVMVLIPIA